MTDTVLGGLDGSNPLAFLAALGTQVVFRGEPEAPRLWWRDELLPRPLVDGDFPVERLVTQALRFRDILAEEVALQFELDGKPIDDVKLAPEAARRYIDACRRASDLSARLAGALIAEGSYDQKGVAKPTDLHFTAGQQRFLKMAREIVDKVRARDIEEALVGPWSYTGGTPSLKWDVTDDRVFAFRARDPAPEKKPSVPGAEFLALAGLTIFPVFGGSSRTVTTGCDGSWKSGHFSWPIWVHPAGPGAVKSLVSHAVSGTTRLTEAAGWGVVRLYKAPIRRSDRGGLGSFGPPSIMITEAI